MDNRVKRFKQEPHLFCNMNAFDLLKQYDKMGGTANVVVDKTQDAPAAHAPPVALTASDITVAVPLVVSVSASASASASAGANAGKMRVLICGTHPIGQSNGYSRVMYYISKYLGLKSDIALTIYGFQNYKQTQGSQMRNDIPKTVYIHDALASEDPKRHGFGEKEIGAFLKTNPQDVVIIFNDMVITASLTQNIIETHSPEERSKFKLVSYMDQVYPYQKKQYIDMLNTYFDAVITFTPYWLGIAKSLGLKESIPMYFFPHGFDAKLYFPVSRKVARIYHNLPQDAFIILNLNRNQPRKRWDLTIMAFAKVVKKYLDSKSTSRPVRLLVATSMTGFWDIMEVYEYELRRLGISIEDGKPFILNVQNPQQLSDIDINLLYNACDIGLNTCEGEGFGLCQFEHAAIGCPQVAPNIGGFKEFLTDGVNSLLVDAKWRYHIDKQRDGIGGVAEVCDHEDIGDAIWKYYQNPKLVLKHGNAARKDILQNYQWESIVDILHRILQKIKPPATPQATPATPSYDINELD